MGLMTAPTPSRQVTVLVDADVLAFKSAYLAESGNLGLAISILRDQVCTIEEETGSTKLIMMLSGNNNYRRDYYEKYKANRNNKPKPKHLSEVVKHIRGNYVYDDQDNVEADDLLGIYQTCTSISDTILATVDKDLLQIPGFHYNLTTRKLTRVSDIEAEHNYLRQCLTGDSTDNIPGIHGIGPKKADKFLLELDPMLTGVEKLKLIRELYISKGLTEQDFATCASLVYIHKYSDCDGDGTVIPRIITPSGEFAKYEATT